MIRDAYSVGASAPSRDVLERLERWASDARKRGSQAEERAYLEARDAILRAEQLADRHARWVRAHCAPIDA